MIRVRRSAVIDAPIERVWAVLRDFNSHDAWHPIVAESRIERGEPSDQVGCVRSFTLKDGNHIREQLLTLSDRDHVSTYCILDATVPMRRYVATVQLKRVTDGNRTFWHWESTFETPRGREQEFADLVGKGVYEGGFEGLRAHLRRGDAPWRRDSAQAASLRSRAILVTRHGGPEVLAEGLVEVPPPGPDEIRIRHSAIGVNYIDTHVRAGRYRMLEPPAPPGMEACGTVIDVGSAVAQFEPGDRVAYVAPQPGAYSALRNVAASAAISLPHDIPDDVGATLMLKGLTAEYLLFRTHALRPGEAVLVHAAAGGVGLFLCAWAKALGARVLGTVSTQDKAQLAREHGCDAAIVVREGRFADAVLAATSGHGVDVIYDGVGGEAHAENLRAIAPLGHWVAYGHAGSVHGAFAPEALSAKSLTVSVPVLFDYTASRERYEAMAARTFEAWRRGVLRPRIERRPLAEAAEVHRALEGRRTVGQYVLEP